MEEGLFGHTEGQALAGPGSRGRNLSPLAGVGRTSWTLSRQVFLPTTGPGLVLIPCRGHLRLPTVPAAPQGPESRVPGTLASPKTERSARRLVPEHWGVRLFRGPELWPQTERVTPCVKWMAGSLGGKSTVGGPPDPAPRHPCPRSPPLSPVGSGMEPRRAELWPLGTRAPQRPHGCCPRPGPGLPVSERQARRTAERLAGFVSTARLAFLGRDLEPAKGRSTSLRKSLMR